MAIKRHKRRQRKWRRKPRMQKGGGIMNNLTPAEQNAASAQESKRHPINNINAEQQINPYIGFTIADCMKANLKGINMDICAKAALLE